MNTLKDTVTCGGSTNSPIENRIIGGISASFLSIKSIDDCRIGGVSKIHCKYSHIMNRSIISYGSKQQHHLFLVLSMW